MKSSPEDLARIPGLTADLAKQILQAAEGKKAEKAEAEKAEAVKTEGEKLFHSSSEPVAQPDKD